MEYLDLLTHIESIIDFIKRLKSNDKVHKEYYDFLLEKYSALKYYITKNEKKKIKELLEWNKYYAPRIIYDGIGNKDLIDLVENLNDILN